MRLLLILAILALPGCAPWTFRVCQGVGCDVEPEVQRPPVIVRRVR